MELFDKFKKKNLKNEIPVEKIENNISEEEKKELIDYNTFKVHTK